MAKGGLFLFNCLFTVFLLSGQFAGGFSFQALTIDVRADIPDNDQWDFDCALGYAVTPDEFVSCDLSGGVNFPPGDLNGEKGFWTKCRAMCVVTFVSKPGDTTFSARLYQRGVSTPVEYDGFLDFVSGTGWVDYSRSWAAGNQTHTISISLEFDGNEIYSLLDKIVINGGVPTTTTARTTVGSSSAGTTGGTTVPTTRPSSAATTTARTTTRPPSSAAP